MAAEVQIIIDELIGREGGYSNHPSDRGGATRWGITEHVARAYGYTGAMGILPRDVAVSIYRQRYWKEPRLNEVALIFANVAIEMFDTGVNMGQSVAVKFLQRSLNLLNRGGKAWPEISVDGAIGSMTLQALRQFKEQRGTGSEIVLIRCLDAMQLARYAEITAARPANEDFFYGWVVNRIGELA